MVGMRDEVTSKHLGTCSELLVIAKIKSGLIQNRQSISYATRMRILLATLHKIRKLGVEAKGGLYAGPINRLQTIFNVNWTLIDNDQKMLLSVVFDQPLETYIRMLVNQAGGVLDSIMCHCEDYDEGKHSTRDGVRGFTHYLRTYQARNELLAVTVPDLTIKDLEYLKKLEVNQRSGCSVAETAKSAAGSSATPNKSAGMSDGEHQRQNHLIALEILSAVYKLVPYFPEVAGHRDHLFLHQMAQEMAFDFKPEQLDSDLRKRFDPVLQWFMDNTFSPQEKRRLTPKKIQNHSDIQGNILEGYQVNHNGNSEPMTHGCLVLLRITDVLAAKRLISNLKITTAEPGVPVKSGVEGTTLNIALTFKGLQNLGIDEEQQNHFPKDFRDGMAARAGLLGDTDHNHPGNWTLPKMNWPLNENDEAWEGPGYDVHLDTVDVVVQLQAHFGAGEISEEIKKGDHKWSVKHPLYEKIKSLLGDKPGVQILHVQALKRTVDSVTHHAREHFGFIEGLSQPKSAELGKTDKDHVNDLVRNGELLLGYDDDRSGTALAIDNTDKALGAYQHNGSFLVLRKLRQHVSRFEKAINDTQEVKQGRISADQLKAKLMGRYPDGRPVVDPARAIDDNNFHYRDSEGKEDGSMCPFLAHTRRANPRKQSSPAPRIMRRGFAYGRRFDPQDDSSALEDRGLIFMAYNASIAEQFETIQRWLSGGNSTGGYSGHRDPFLGVRSANPNQDHTIIVAHHGEDIRFNPGGKPFVTLAWGLYLFAPSLSAIKALVQSNKCVQPYPRANTQRAVNLLYQFSAIEKFDWEKRQVLHAAHQAGVFENSELALRWKQLTEEPSADQFNEDLWKAVRTDYYAAKLTPPPYPQKPGIMRTPYGVLVGSEKLITQVLGDADTYSVREYWDRMDKADLELYLGMDANPHDIDIPNADAIKECLPEVCRLREQAEVDRVRDLNSRFIAATKGRYCRESAKINEWLYHIDDLEAFKKAFQAARGRIANHKKINSSLAADIPNSPLHLLHFASDILCLLARDRFGLPKDDSIQYEGVPQAGRLHCAEAIQDIATYFFYPNPTQFVSTQGQASGKALLSALESYVKTQTGCASDGTLFGEINGKFDAKKTAQILAGATNGFIAPTLSSFICVAMKFIATGELFRLQQDVRRALSNQPFDWHDTAQAGGEFNKLQEILKPAIIRAMQEQPRPPYLHRTATSKTTLGGLAIEPGEQLVLGIVSGTLEQLEDNVQDEGRKTDLLFGGHYRNADCSKPGNANKAAPHACPGQKMAFGTLIGLFTALLNNEETLEITGRLSVGFKK